MAEVAAQPDTYPLHAAMLGGIDAPSVQFDTYLEEREAKATVTCGDVVAVMDAMTLVSPAETERRAANFAAEFLAPIEDIGFDLDRVSMRTVHELDELRMTWGVSVSSLVVRARERGVLSDYQSRSMFRLLNETGRIDGPRPGVADEHPTLVGIVLEQLTAAGYTSHELNEISLLTSAQRAGLFHIADQMPGARHLTMV